MLMMPGGHAILSRPHPHNPDDADALTSDCWPKMQNTDRRRRMMQLESFITEELRWGRVGLKAGVQAGQVR